MVKKETAAPRDAKADFRLYGYVGGGLSLAGFGTATYFGLKARGIYDDLSDGKYPADDVRSKVDEGKTSQTVMVAGVAAGGVLAAAGGYLLYRGFFGDGTLFGGIVEWDKAVVTVGGSF